MITVFDDYVILVDSLQYTVAKDLHKTDKDGKPMYKSISYHGTLRSAVKGILTYEVKNKLSNDKRTLTEAISVLNGIYNRIDSLLEKINE